MIRTRAAVAIAPNKPLEIMEVYLDGPQKGEVLVEIKACGICQKDEFILSGANRAGIFPAILGHEGAGVVIELGKDVTKLKLGDHVIPLSLCETWDYPLQNGNQPSAPHRRFSMPDGTPIYHFTGCSTFANHSVMAEAALAKVDPTTPFDKICYIAGDVATGIGAVLDTAKVENGAKAVVFGLGSIGLNVLQGLKMAGADMIIGVDLNDDKKEWGEAFGMTHFVNPSKIEGTIVQHIIDLTKTPYDRIGGADYGFDCTGNVKVMRDALECTHSGWGVCVVIGEADVQSRPFELATGRIWKGTAFGAGRSRTDLSKIVDWYRQGKIEVDRLLTHKLTLDEINAGFDLMRAGKTIRAVVEF